MKRRSILVTLGLFAIVVCFVVLFSQTFQITETLMSSEQPADSRPNRSRVPDYGIPSRKEFPNGTPKSGVIPKLPSSDTAADLRKVFTELRVGQIGFKTPTQMKVDEAELVEVHLSDDLQRDLKLELGDKAEVAQTKVSDFVKARLDGINFDIESLNEENRVIFDGNLVKWRWSVTPRKSGEQKLFLTVYARVKLSDESEELVDLKTFQRKIKVTVSKSSWFKQNWISVIEIAIALGGAGFFAFIIAKWKAVKSIVRKSLKR
ncbi:MAG: hypothetical protein KI793_26975 [Rivularia sp. (in: Bacteria)]|nr:hypothetical protein [Rivularia sp. MS3]